jgi:hypothetical protein
VLLIRRIRELLYDQGFTISGARNRLAEGSAMHRAAALNGDDDESNEVDASALPVEGPAPTPAQASASGVPADTSLIDPESLRAELQSIRDLLTS